MLHLTNGDSAAGSLRQSGVPGEVVAWPDVLHEGPVPADHGATARHIRAKYLSTAGYGAFADILRDYTRRDAALGQYRVHDELVLWFEHDLYDQLLLARHLHWLGAQGHAGTRLSLICIDRFPGVEPFSGLGQLTPEQLASLFPSRQPIAPAHLRTGAEVWRALVSDDPTPLNAIARDGLADLPFMAGAIERHLQEFPGLRDGLSRTERVVLGALGDGPRPVRDLFTAFQQQEERVFMGDAPFWRIVREMSAEPHALLHLSGSSAPSRALPGATASLAPAGRRVLDGEDAVRLRGISRWLGGVRLSPERVWRWDGSGVRLT